MNLRDYAGAFLMEEDKTKLYYAVRAIKDYLEDGVLSEDDISFLPGNLLSVIHSSVDEITALYKASDFDIISQYFDKKSELDKTDWEILFNLIRLGHYDVSEEHVQQQLRITMKPIIAILLVSMTLKTAMTLFFTENIITEFLS